MMFSSNHILTATGCLDHAGELKSALEYALKTSGWLNGFTRPQNPTKCVYQIIDDTYCIGWHNPNYKLAEGWKEFPFDFDLEIIAKIIIQHIDKSPMPLIEEMGYDGSCEKGFIMNNIERGFDSYEIGIKHPEYGIVSFQPYTCYYAK